MGVQQFSTCCTQHLCIHVQAHQRSQDYVYICQTHALVAYAYIHVFSWIAYGTMLELMLNVSCDHCHGNQCNNSLVLEEIYDLF